MIRYYTVGDFSRCNGIVNEVWRFTEKFKPIKLSNLFLDVYTAGSLGGSNYAIVVEDDGYVQGFLFGTCGGDAKLIKTRYSGLSGGLVFLSKLLCMRGVTWKMKRSYIAMMKEHEVNRLAVEKHREHEVHLFAVSPNAQGKGYGKALMEAFIGECVKNQVRRVTLDTDKECNFRFYEHFGYKRIAQFYSPLQKMYTGNDGSSFVYELLLGDSV